MNDMFTQTSFKEVKIQAKNFETFQEAFLSKSRDSLNSLQETDIKMNLKKIPIVQIDEEAIKLNNVDLHEISSPTHTFHPPIEEKIKTSNYTLSVISNNENNEHLLKEFKDKESSPNALSLASSPGGQVSCFGKKPKRLRPRNSRTLEIGPKGTIIDNSPKNTFTEVMDFRKKGTSFINNNLLEEHLKKRNSTVIPFVKKFMSKLKNASSFRNIAQLKDTNFKLLNDSTYFYDEVIKEQNLLDSEGFKKFFLNLQAFYESQLYRLKKLLCLKWFKTIGSKYRTVFHPYQTIKILWDICHLMVIVFWFFYIPLLMAFEEVHTQQYSQQYRISFISSLFLIIDIIVNLNTSYFKNGVVERRRSKIFSYYISTRFPYDFITCLPILLDWIISIHAADFNFINFQSYRTIHYIKFLFFVKFTTFREISNRILEKFLLKEKFQNILALFKVFFISILVAHLFACFWFLTADLSQTSETWLTKLNLKDSTWNIQYLYSMYWASITMMTVGYGDIVPQNDSETIVCLISVLLGCAVYAYNINSIGMILQDLNKESISFNHNINIINQFMQRKKINNDLQMRIREYLRFIWKEENAQNLEEEHKIIELLSSSLKEELLIEAYGSVLKKYPMFFANFSENSLRKVVNIIKDIKLIPDENVFLEEDDDALSIFFIMKGKVELYVSKEENPLVVRELGVGDYFGEIGFFSGKKRVLSAKSKDFTTLFSINREEFIKVLQKNSDDFEKFCMIQDQIQLYENYFPLKLRCFSCNQLGHLAGQCHLIHFMADQEKVIKTYNFYIDQERDENWKRKVRKINALKTKKTLLTTSRKIKDMLKKEKDALNELNIGNQWQSMSSSEQLFSEEGDEDDEDEDDEVHEPEIDELKEEEDSPSDDDKTNEELQPEILTNDNKNSLIQLNNNDNNSINPPKKIANIKKKYSSSHEDLVNFVKEVKEEGSQSNSAYILNIPKIVLQKRHSASAAMLTPKNFDDPLTNNTKEGHQEIRSKKGKGSTTDIHRAVRKKTLESSTVTSHSYSKNKIGSPPSNEIKVSVENIKKMQNSNPNINSVSEDTTKYTAGHRSILKVPGDKSISPLIPLDKHNINAMNNFNAMNVINAMNVHKNSVFSKNAIANNLLGLRPSLYSNNPSNNKEITSITNMEKNPNMLNPPLPSSVYDPTNEVNKILDNFDRVQNFKNYFPHNNCKVVSEALNMKKIIPLKYSKSLKERRKSIDARLAKYTFFLDEMKDKMPEAIKKKAAINNKKKREGFIGRIPTFKEEQGGYKFDEEVLKKNQKNWQTKQYFTGLLNREQNKLNFSDVVNLILHDPFLKKQIKKKVKIISNK